MTFLLQSIRMKSTFTLLVGLLLLSLTGCFATREARIESDYSYSGTFKRYRTYEFMRGQGLASDSSRLGEALRDAVRNRLRAQGYRPTATRPDLLINFQVFEGDMRFRGYMQEDLERWVKMGVVEDDETPDEYKRGYKPMRMLLSEGTLLVTLIDNHTNRAVWNGYASGVTVPNGPRGEIVLRRSVRSIFDQYRVFTEGYVGGGN